MDEFIGQLGSKLKVSITDSTMMGIVHDAMDRAHGKVKSRGVIARLSEMSRFYELAIIQLEGCLKFVHEEAEDCGFDAGQQDLLLDLAKIRNHLLRRLEESEMAISNKDREMMERAETEKRLRRALEMKEKELKSLKAQSEGFDDDRGEEDEPNIRQDLEGTDRVRHYENRLGCESTSASTSTSTSPRGDKRIEERMGFDISSLKETLDLAFEKMQRSILSSDAGPTEQQLRWIIEEDVIGSVIKGSVRDIQEILKTEMAIRQDEEDEVRKLNQENEELKFREKTVDELYVEILRGLMDEMHTGFLDFGVEVEIREEIFNRVLKDTLDLAFGKMQKIANLSIEAGEADQQWRWSIEKDVTACVIKGSIRRVQETVMSEIQGQEANTEIANLQDEVQKLKQGNVELKHQERMLSSRLSDIESEVDIQEGIRTAMLKEAVIENKLVARKMQEDINNTVKNYTTESYIREEILHLVYDETLRSIASTRNAEFNRCIQIEARELDDAFGFGMKNNVCRYEVLMDPEELTLCMDRFLQEFLEAMSNYEHKVCNYLEKNILRLENMKHQVDFLFEQTGMLKEKESIYKKAFINRCENLQKAETEVDLLGDQVDLLLGLLEIIYMKLRQHSTVSGHPSEVSEILMLIEKELGGQELQV